MNKYFLLFLISSFSLFSQTYITNVTVVDVENEKLTPNQTVVITGDRISNIQKNKKIKLPENAITIDGTGKYLTPGLIDSHIHFFQNGGVYARPDAIDLRKFMPYDKEIALTKSDMENKLKRYLKNGITTLIDVGATYNFLEQRKEFVDKKFAPKILMTGPLLTTYLPSVYKDLGKDQPFILTETIEAGVNAVREQLPYNPDFIKIWYITRISKGETIAQSARKNLPVIKAIIDEAHKNNLKIAIHATSRITAQLSVENGADYLVHSVSDEVLKDDFIQLMKKKKTILSPTLVVSDGYINTYGHKHHSNAHKLQKANPYQLGSLLDLKHLPDTIQINKKKKYVNTEKFITRFKKTKSIESLNLKKLSDAGVLIATGTDAGNIGTLHASSYLEEVLEMKKSGMDTWKIMQASTINGAKILDKENEFGTVSVGKKANLVLLNANPIENIENLTKINTVINKGTVFDPNEILKDSPEDLAQRQLNAYNFRDIDAFLDVYDENVEVYNFPNELKYKGKEIMRKRYSKMFDNTPNLHCELVNRIVYGNTVIDEERVQFGNRIIEAVAIYHIDNNKIKKVYFVPKKSKISSKNK